MNIKIIKSTLYVGSPFCISQHIVALDLIHPLHTYNCLKKKRMGKCVRLKVHLRESRQMIGIKRNDGEVKKKKKEKKNDGDIEREIKVKRREKEMEKVTNKTFLKRDKDRTKVQEGQKDGRAPWFPSPHQPLLLSTQPAVYRPHKESAELLVWISNSTKLFSL